MDINNIKTLVNPGTYKLDCQLRQLQSTVQTWEKEGLELCPDFQRGHIWTPMQQISFVEYILRGGKTSEFLFNTKGNYMFITEEFVCVDGLQRLTALLKFLDNRLPVFDGHTRSQINGIENRLKGIYLQFYINELMTRKEVLEWYIELNSVRTPHTPDEIDRVKKLLQTEK